MGVVYEAEDLMLHGYVARVGKHDDVYRKPL
jgi:hypothetical protein